jgi:glycosyltransferase involved in cell wall biosynthesis
MNKTKVVHIITKLELGGAQQNTLFTVAHLNRSEYEPVLIAGTEGLLVEDSKKLEDVKVYLIPELVREINPLKDVIALIKIMNILKRLKADVQKKKMKGDLFSIIVHTHSSKAGILGRWAARLAGVKLIIHSIHGFSFHDYQPSLVRAFYIIMERVTAFITDRFIAVSKANIEKGINSKIFTGEEVVLIRSGIDIEEFQNVNCSKIKKRREMGVDEKKPLVAMIGCFKFQKDPLDFVKVARIVSDKMSEVNFIMVGDGILRPDIEELIEKLNMKNKIFLLGWRRDIQEIMSIIDVLVLTSLWEGLPRIFPQAMASGIPVVATEVDGAPEAIKDGKNGFLLPPKDVIGIAEKIVYLIKHPEKASEMGAEGRKLVEEFDIWKMVAKQEELYKGLLNNLNTGNINESA